MPGPFSVAKDAGDLYTYNIHHGFPEGLVRGYRSGFLTDMVRYSRFSVCVYIPCCLLSSSTSSLFCRPNTRFS